MDNGENKMTPESIEKSAIQSPENWTPNNPEHNLSELGSNAIGNAIFSSTPEEETPSPQLDQPFNAAEVFPIEEPKTKAKTDESEPNLIFNPSDIKPQKEGISPSTEAAARSIEDLIIRGDDPSDAYDNYQALRKAANESNSLTGGNEK